MMLRRYSSSWESLSMQCSTLPKRLPFYDTSNDGNGIDFLKKILLDYLVVLLRWHQE